MKFVRYFKDEYGRIWKKFPHENFVTNDELGRGYWGDGKGLIEIEPPQQSPH